MAATRGAPSVDLNLKAATMPSHIKPINPITMNTGCQGKSSPEYILGSIASNMAMQHRIEMVCGTLDDSAMVKKKNLVEFEYRI